MTLDFTALLAPALWVMGALVVLPAALIVGVALRGAVAPRKVAQTVSCIHLRRKPAPTAGEMSSREPRVRRLAG